ncbi:MAG: repressor LexA [Clostridia bacterium]|nr:repressor LexA [Clostridia bacterium]
MPKDLTPRQQAILDYIQQFTLTHGYPPSVREIGKALGLRSSATVHSHLIKLQKKGYLRRNPSKPRALEVISLKGIHKELKPVPLIGRITAGEPIFATQNYEDIFPLPIDLLSGENVFMLTVQGDSMLEAGILDGDYVIVRQQETAENGDIIVALLEEEATVKYFFQENGCFRLQPANSKYEPIITKHLKILGKVIGLFRRYP